MLIARVSLIEINPQLIKRFVDAARFDDVSEVIDMLGDGMPINSRDKDGYTALYWAVFNNHTEVVDELLENGADVNVRNSSYDWTPLHAAAHSNNTDMIKVLLEHGAERSIRNNRGETALDVARMFNGEEAIQQLLEN